METTGSGVSRTNYQLCSSEMDSLLFQASLWSSFSNLPFLPQCGRNLIEIVLWLCKMKPLISSKSFLPLLAQALSSEVPGAQNLIHNLPQILTRQDRNRLQLRRLGFNNRSGLTAFVNASSVTWMGKGEAYGSLCPSSCSYPVALPVLTQSI